MSNWTGMARSNYVTPTTPEAFREYVELFGAQYIERRYSGVEPGTVCGFYTQEEYGLTPYRTVEDEDDIALFASLGITVGIDDQVSIMDGIHRVLAPGEVIYVIEVGYEKARYCTGHITMVHSSGEREDVDLEQIAEQIAEKRWGIHLAPAAY
jgi:hypothetical protein